MKTKLYRVRVDITDTVYVLCNDDEDVTNIAMGHLDTIIDDCKYNLDRYMFDYDEVDVDSIKEYEFKDMKHCYPYDSKNAEKSLVGKPVDKVVEILRKHKEEEEDRKYADEKQQRLF